MNRRLKAKLPLIGSLSVSLFALLTAGVSTFAWFQAHIDVSINSVQSSTQITVAPPEGAEFTTPDYYIYQNFDTDEYLHDGTATGSLAGETPTNFVKVSDLGAEIDDIHMIPGKRLTFGIKSRITTSVVRETSLTLAGYASKNSLKRKIITNYNTMSVAKISGGADRIIRVEEAVELYGQINKTGEFIGSLDVVGNRKQVPYNINDQQTTDAAKSYSNVNLKIATASSLTNVTNLYYFYTITLAQDNDATYYQEYKSANSIEYDTPSADTNDRYFYKTTEGNSNCYEGLEFKITHLNLTAS